MINNLDNFIWEPKIYDGFKEFVYNEIFVNNVYEKILSVDEGDIVFDIGASLGPFTFSILHKNPKNVFAFEPDTESFLTLVKNTIHGPVTAINKGLCSKNNERSIIIMSNNYEQKLTCISFSEIIEMYNLNKIDFIKIDCEGCEYNVFNDENMPWILNNVKKIVGEWHLSTQELKNNFINFRDSYLKLFKSYKILSIDCVDITDNVFSDFFINYYNEVNIHIDNR